MTDSGVDALFDPLDAIRSEDVDELLDELREANLQADVVCTDSRGVLEAVTIVALVTLATTTVLGLIIVVAFMQRAFAVGVVVDASKARVRVRKDDTLPRGSVLVIPRSGEPVLSYNVSGDDLGRLMASVLHSRGSSTE